MTYFLKLTTNSTSKRLEFLEEAEILPIGHDSRISPIFPLFKDLAQPPDLSASSFLLLCFCDNPFLTLGKVSQLYTETANEGAWYSHGIAAVLVFSTKLEMLLSIGQNPDLGLRGFEVWSIEQGIVSRVESHLMASESPIFEELSLSQIPERHIFLINEFRIALRRAGSYAAQYFPEQIVLFDALNKKLVRMLDRLRDEVAKNDGTLSGREGLLRAGHAFDEQLVEINSALTLLLAQGYSGGSPVFEGMSNHQRYSLFGIGNALNAVFAIYSFVYKTFEKFGIDSQIKKFYSNEGMRGFNVNQQKTWGAKPPRLDDLIEMGSNQEAFDNYHLMYFSGRWGFHASLHTVTAAVQSIYGAASSEWSLMTLTHEFMHAHVRAILDTIKYSPRTEMAELEALAREYDSLATIDTSQFTMRRCLNLALLHFCMLRDQSTLVPTEHKSVADARTAIRILRDHDAHINEII